MRSLWSLALLLLTRQSATFMLPHLSAKSTHTARFAKSRKARRVQKVDRSRSEAFYEAIEDSKDSLKKDKPVKEKPVDQVDKASSTDQLEAERQARLDEAQRRMEQRPEVSTMIVDEETGIEIVAQGKSVMDVVTRKPVKLSSLGPEYRLAQMFPGVPPAIREKYRFDWKSVSVSEMVEKLGDACSVKLEDGSQGIPPHPSVANKAIDFVLANRDYLGPRMKKTLGRLAMRAASQMNKEQVSHYQGLWKNFLTLENHISAPFRQILMDAEGRVGPQFGNLDVKSYCNGEIYERAANYLVLKGMVAHWEKKVIDADYYEKTPQTKQNYISVLSRGDPRRYLPDPPILFTLKECTQVCYMAQQMTKAFVETPELFNDLPPEIRFIEHALAIKTGTTLRKFIIEEFCPAEGIEPEGLREGVRRLIVQLDNMQVDPYADITNTLERLERAMSFGTDDERDPFIEYLVSKDRNGPGHFQTYTFDHEALSLVRFLDSQYEGTSGAELPKLEVGGLGGLFNLGGGAAKEEVPKPKTGDTYKVPKARAAGRPHELGWLDLLKDNNENLQLGKVPPGRIIPDE